MQPGARWAVHSGPATPLYGVLGPAREGSRICDLPADKVLHCWAPLQVAFDRMSELHAKAALQVERLFPNRQAFVPVAVEEEPTSDVDDDFADEDPEYNEQPQARARRVEVEHARAADMAAALAVPAQRPRRGAALAANAAMDNLHARGELQ